MLDTLLTILAASLLIASLVAWQAVIRRWWHGVPLVPEQPRQSVPWGLIDVIVAICLLFVLGGVAYAVISWATGGSLDQLDEAASLVAYRWSVAAQSLASLATLTLVAAMIIARCGASWRDLGLDAGTVRSDIQLGTIAFCALAPPTYALQFVLVQWVESKHPLVELLRERPDPTLLGLSVVAAVIVAPVFEEFLFRVLLQGWLESFVGHTADPVRLFFGRPAEERSRDGAVAGNDKLVCPQYPVDWSSDGVPWKQGNANPYIPPGDTDGDSAPPVFTWKGTATARFYFPIVGSSLLFALMHLTHGPDWIPLFFLALGLGYLYRQTHRLLPCVTVHLLFNGCSMLMFLAEMLRAAVAAS